MNTSTARHSAVALSVLLAIAACGSWAGSSTWAQSPGESTPRFEVASIKLSKDAAPDGNIEVTPGRFKGKDLALQWLILTAYRIKSDKLSGNLPSWTISERYDIEATTEDASGEERVLAALQNLLKDRFQLKEHREMKEEPVYFLKVGKSGNKMPKGSCVPVKKDLPNECYSSKSDGLIQSLDWRGVSMSDPAGIAYRSLAWALAGPLKRPVIDKTGLAGTFDVHLRWARDPEPASIGAPSDPNASLSSTPAPSLFDALDNQLGLTVEQGRGPVEHLVVDHVEKPTANE